MRRPLTIVLTADCCNGPFAEHADPGRWDAIFDAARDLRQRFDAIGGPDFRLTWFVRADAQIGAALGDPWAHHHRYRALLEAWASRGDEIGFHPHCFEADPAANVAMIRQVFTTRPALPYPLTSSRIGEAYMTPTLMATLRELGLTRDASALPGRLRAEPPPHDWSRAPADSYFPTPADYQRAGPASTLLEVPFSMLQVQGPSEALPRSRYLNLGFQSQALQPALENWLPSQELVVAIVHPVEQLAPSEADRARFPLLAFDPAVTAANLAGLLALAVSAERPLRWQTLREVAPSVLP